MFSFHLRIFVERKGCIKSHNLKWIKLFCQSSLNLGMFERKGLNFLCSGCSTYSSILIGIIKLGQELEEGCSIFIIFARLLEYEICN